MSESDFQFDQEDEHATSKVTEYAAGEESDGEEAKETKDVDKNLMHDIFGSDSEDDEAPKTAKPKSTPSKTAYEREFKYPEIPNFPAPKESQKLFYTRLPKNAMNIESKPFDEESFRQEYLSFQQDQEDRGNAMNLLARQRMLAYENVMRWRIKPGENVTEEDFNSPDIYNKLETNTRLVKWSDGSWQILVGNHSYEVKKQDMALDNVHLFIRTPNLIYGQGKLTKKLVVAPDANISSKLTKGLKWVSKIATKTKEKEKRKTKLTRTEKDPEKVDTLKKEKSKLQEKQKRTSGASSHERLDVEAIEDGATDDVSLKQLKKNYRGKRKRKESSDEEEEPDTDEEEEAPIESDEEEEEEEYKFETDEKEGKRRKK